MPQSSPAKPQRALESAQGYLLLEMPDAVLRELRDFGDGDETPMAVNQLRGEALRMRGDFDEALQCFEKVLSQVDNKLSVLMAMAWCFKRIGRLDKAIEVMKETYRSSPKEAAVLYNLACYYSLAGEKEEALSWLARAIRLDASFRKLIPRESDFDPIRNDPEFLHLLQISEPKLPKKTS